MPPLAVLAILAIFLILASFVCWLEGLTVFAPKSTQRLSGAAQTFCLDQCRTDEGECPLGIGPEPCPMWRFIRADLRTDFRTDPFREFGEIMTT